MGQKGIKKSLESRQKMSKSHLGLKIPKEVRLKMSLAHRGISPWNAGLHNEITKQKLGSHLRGKSPWNKGRPTPAHVKDKISLSKKGQLPWIAGKKHTEESIKKMRSFRVKLIRNYTKESKLETTVYEALEKKIQFKKQVDLLGITVCDLFIKPNHAIYLDGCFFHGCEKCMSSKSLRSQIPIKTKNRDKKIDKILKNNNYNVIRIPEHDVKKDLQKTIDKLLCEVL